MKNLSLTFLIALVLNPAVLLADFRVATIDVNRVLNESPDAQGSKKALEAKAEGARKKIDERKKALQATKERLEKAKVDSESKEAQKFRSDVRDLERMAKDSEDEVRREFMKVNRTLAERAVKVISDYAKKNDIDLVLDKSSQGRSIVLFGNDSFDITDEVVAQLKRG